ncbi:transcription factor bHLH146-like [Curcuma longa]|uniref:transcription factor bHLH146-like n=1 Tax=Curcuma longa TaxID=136217 RepID=UPI003D9F1D1A
MDNDGKADAGLLERSRRIKMAAEIGLARSSRGRHWSRALLRRRLLVSKEETTSTTCEAAASSLEVEEPEEELVEARVRTLQRLVPGGEDLGVEKLFEETADYVQALQEQVNAMRALACMLHGFDRTRGGGR